MVQTAPAQAPLGAGPLGTVPRTRSSVPVPGAQAMRTVVSAAVVSVTAHAPPSVHCASTEVQCTAAGQPASEVHTAPPVAQTPALHGAPMLPEEHCPRK